MELLMGNYLKLKTIINHFLKKFPLTLHFIKLFQNKFIYTINYVNNFKTSYFMLYNTEGDGHGCVAGHPQRPQSIPVRASRVAKGAQAF